MKLSVGGAALAFFSMGFTTWAESDAPAGPVVLESHVEERLDSATGIDQPMAESDATSEA